MKVSLFLPATLVASFILVGCQSPPPHAHPRTAPRAEQTTHDNAYSLLHQLFGDEKHVDLLHFIKREESDVKKLVKKIANRSAAGEKLLEDLARQQPSIDLKAICLPPGEIATRDAIAATRKKELLGQKGDRFELTLLLTQVQALGYATHLAKVAAETDPQPERARALTGLQVEMNDLYEEVVALLLGRTK